MAKARALFSAALALMFLLMAASAPGYDEPNHLARGRGVGSLARQFLVEHNAVRVALGERPLVWDDELTQYAQWWATERQGDCELQHSNGRYGENIFWGSGEGWTPAQAVASWVSERQAYKYLSNSCEGEACGHYTQVVWRATRRLGCASVACDGGKGTFITCNYDPPGNYNGERPY